jgi:hypothetical protein
LRRLVTTSTTSTSSTTSGRRRTLPRTSALLCLIPCSFPFPLLLSFSSLCSTPLDQLANSPSLHLRLLTLLLPCSSLDREDEELFKTSLSDSLAKGTTWERICTLVDLQDSRSKTTTKSKQDLTRFKEILLSLKREGENAPGAGGY